MVKPSNSQAQAAVVKPAMQAGALSFEDAVALLHRVFVVLLPPFCARLEARLLSLETTGDPCSANSAAPQGCMGQGYGAAGPMSTVVQPVPVESVPVHRSAAQGIVTRMGQDPQGLGGEAIEPGPAGMRPAAAVAVCWGACGVCDCAGAPAACKRSAGAGASAMHTPPSNTGVDKIGSGHGV